MKFTRLQKCTWYNQGQIPFYFELKKHIEAKGIKDIERHIGPVIKEEWPWKNIGQGITFKPLDYDLLYRKITQSGKFQEDDRRELVGAFAAWATKGTGFRSPGSPSIHIAMKRNRVNIHLDQVGFVHIGKSGKGFYGPDCLQHVVDELVLASIFKLHGRNFKLHSILPTTANGFRNVAGLSLSYKTDNSISGKYSQFGLKVETRFTDMPQLGKNLRDTIKDPLAMTTIFRSEPVQGYIGLFYKKVY